MESKQKDLDDEIHDIRDMSEDISDKLKSTDIGPAVYNIDPTGELVNHLLALAELYNDPDNPTIYSQRIIELRGMIEKLIKDSIRKFS